MNPFIPEVAHTSPVTAKLSPTKQLCTKYFGEHDSVKGLNKNIALSARAYLILRLRKKKI